MESVRTLETQATSKADLFRKVIHGPRFRATEAGCRTLGSPVSHGPRNLDMETPRPLSRSTTQNLRPTLDPEVSGKFVPGPGPRVTGANCCTLGRPATCGPRNTDRKVLKLTQSRQCRRGNSRNSKGLKNWITTSTVEFSTP